MVDLPLPGEQGRQTLAYITTVRERASGRTMCRRGVCVCMRGHTVNNKQKSRRGDKASPRVITILHVRGFLYGMCMCVRETARAGARSVSARECESESVASMWITRVRVRDPLSRRLSSSVCAAARLVCPYPSPLFARAIRRPLFVAVSLRRPRQRTPTYIHTPTYRHAEQ